MKVACRLLGALLIILLLVTAAVRASTASIKGVGNQNVLIIMAKFPDMNPTFSIDTMTKKYFEKLPRYVRAISYGKASITGTITDWYTLPGNVASYRLSPHNLAVDKGRVTRLIQDALDLADKDYDFAQYSMIFISLGARRRDYGMMGLCGYPGMLGWRHELPVKTKIRSQKIPNGVAIYCENAHVGVVWHDMAHILGGVSEGKRRLPCLYDHDLQAQKGSFRNYARFYLTNVGFFDPMSCHFYKLKQGPPGICAWTKLRLDWIDAQKIVEVPKGESRSVILGPLSSAKSRVHVVRLPIDNATYYLIENRLPIGPDRNLPSHGVLIYYCDDRIAECRQGRSPVKLINANPSVPELRGAPFTCQGNNVYQNDEHNIRIKLIDRDGFDYQIQVSNLD